jgi:hypothetical protein
MALLRLVAVRTRLPTIDGTPSASAMSAATGDRGNANYAGIRTGLPVRFMRAPGGVGRLTSVGFRLSTVKVGSRERGSLTSRPSRSRNEHVEGNRGGRTGLEEKRRALADAQASLLHGEGHRCDHVLPLEL